MLRRIVLFFTVLTAVAGVLGQSAPPNVDATLREMLASMNRSVDPCDDFYEYTCGNWHVHNPIPPDAESFSERAKLRVKTTERLRDILSQPTDEPDDADSIKLARAYYRSCLNEEAIEARGLEPIFKILTNNGGWPILQENWTSSTKTWQTIHTTYLRLYDTGALYNIKLNPDSENSSRVDIVINQEISYPLLNAESSDDPNDLLASYAKAINDVIGDFIKASGNNVTEESLGAMSGLFVFQMSLPFIKELTPAPANASDYDRLTIKQLQEYYDNDEPRVEHAHIDFLSQIKTVFEEISEKITEDTIVEVHNKHHFLGLKSFLSNSSLQNILNYVHWNMVAHFLPYTTRKMRTILHAVHNPFYNGTQEKPRWETCVNEMLLEEALSFAFVKKYANDAVIGKASDMASRIRGELKRRASQSPNLKDVGKEFVTTKLDGLNFIIGYPQWYSNESAVTHFYDGLTVGADYFDNVVNYKLFERKKYVHTYGEPFDKYSWFESSTPVNAFYYPQANSIALPLARFMDIFAGPTVPDFLTYSRVGFLLGHEMTHAITGQGLEYDANGNMLSAPVDEATEEGEKNSLCIEREFGKYILHETDVLNETIYLDGVLTKFENLADVLGIQVANDVYLSAKGEINQFTAQLPQEFANFTDKQLFFVSFASAWCETIRPETENIGFNIDVHTPTKYRVIGAVSNSAAFASAFSCPSKSPMNPTEKCRIL